MDTSKNDAELNLPPLQEKCTYCHGDGRDRFGECDYCCGSGWMPTEFGDRVISLIRNHRRAIFGD